MIENIMYAAGCIRPRAGLLLLHRTEDCIMFELCLSWNCFVLSLFGVVLMCSMMLMSVLLDYCCDSLFCIQPVQIPKCLPVLSIDSKMFQCIISV